MKSTEPMKTKCNSPCGFIFLKHKQREPASSSLHDEDDNNNPRFTCLTFKNIKMFVPAADHICFHAAYFYFNCFQSSESFKILKLNPDPDSERLNLSNSICEKIQNVNMRNK